MEFIKRTMFRLPNPRPGEGPAWRPFVMPVFRDGEMIYERPPIYRQIFTGRYNIIWKYGYVPDVDWVRRYGESSKPGSHDPSARFYNEDIKSMWVNRTPPTPTPPPEVQADWSGRIIEMVRQHEMDIERRFNSNVRSRNAVAASAIAHSVELNRSAAAAGAAERAGRNQLRNQHGIQLGNNTTRSRRRKHRKTRKTR